MADDKSDHLKLLELRSEIIALASVVVQINTVVSRLHRAMPIVGSSEIGAEIEELNRRTQSFLHLLGKDSFNG